MECLGLSFVDRKSTKVITNKAGIRFLPTTVVLLLMQLSGCCLSKKRHTLIEH
jgi:hypothetical protein